MPLKTESPAPDEIREGTAADPPEGVEGGLPSRKRSAKGAKNTKAPMDAECGCGGKGRKGKAACDGSCGKAMKDGGSYPMKSRTDALTPQEYLAACDLGIQGRSRTYIRARLDATGQGKKCGGGHIAANKKCSKGGGGSRNLAAEMAEQRQIMQSNTFNSWRKANKLRKPTTQGAFDRQFKQYSGSQHGAAVRAAYKRHSKLKQERNRRNAGYAFLGGAALGLTAGLLATRRPGRRSAASGAAGSSLSSSAGTAPRSPSPSGGPVTPVRVRVEQGRLPGYSPRALLAPAPPRKSKTQRMRENTAAAMRQAEGRIGQTAREEVRRIAQIGNTMASVGEATGMAVKTSLREVRLRTQAARRRFEPGFRSPDQRRLPAGTQAQLPESGLTPERIALPIDPRTGQPRRRRARGFGRSDSGMQFLHSRYIDPARSDTQNDGKKYSKTVTNPETGRKNKVRFGAKGYKIAPGTSKGDRYCARSFGDMKSHGKDCSGPDRNTPLCLSRAKWKCSGKTSRRDEGLMRTDAPSTDYYRTHPEAAAKKVRHQAEINRRPEERKRRAELNRERRRRGIAGKGGPDISHTSSGKTVLEDPTTNRGRNGHGKQPRLKGDSIWAEGFV